MEQQTQTRPLPEPGDRVEVTGTMPSENDPIEVGEQGTVTEVHADVCQIFVDWDSGRRLILLTGDPYRVLYR